MIQKFAGHAANERTFLAWIRTAIAVMTFGFLVERFDLSVSSLGGGLVPPSKNPAVFSAEIAGKSLMLVAMLVIMGATISFYTFTRSIETEQLLPFARAKTNLVLSIPVTLLVLSLIVLMGHQVRG